MNNIITETPLQNPQEAMPTPMPVVESIQDIGYTKRPIDQRTQVRNVYLDGIVATAEVLTEIPDWPGERQKITWYSYTTKWKYNFFPTADDITIPDNWTYIITLTFKWDTWFGSIEETQYEVLLNNTQIWWDFKVLVDQWETVNTTIVRNFNKWDILTVNVLHIDIYQRTSYVDISTTKLS